MLYYFMLYLFYCIIERIVNAKTIKKLGDYLCVYFQQIAVWNGVQSKTFLANIPTEKQQFVRHACAKMNPSGEWSDYSSSRANYLIQRTPG